MFARLVESGITIKEELFIAGAPCLAVSVAALTLIIVRKIVLTGIHFLVMVSFFSIWENSKILLGFIYYNCCILGVDSCWSCGTVMQGRDRYLNKCHACKARIGLCWNCGQSGHGLPACRRVRYMPAVRPAFLPRELLY